MNNSVLKGAFGALLAVGGLLLAKKIKDRKRAIGRMFDEYDIKDRTPFGFADKIRDMNPEEYEALKSKMKERFAARHCRHRAAC